MTLQRKARRALAPLHAVRFFGLGVGSLVLAAAGGLAVYLRAAHYPRRVPGGQQDGKDKPNRVSDPPRDQ